MDLVIDTDQMIFVNNEEAGLDTLVYENFSVEWKTVVFVVVMERKRKYLTPTYKRNYHPYSLRSIYKRKYYPSP